MSGYRGILIRGHRPRQADEDEEQNGKRRTKKSEGSETEKECLLQKRTGL